MACFAGGEATGGAALLECGQGIDMAKVDKLRFEFHVTYERDGFTLTYFGKDPKTYPQGLGTVCDDAGEDEAPREDARGPRVALRGADRAA